MTEADPTLVAAAQDFAQEIADLLAGTVAADQPIGAQIAADRVVVSAFDDDGNSVDVPLRIAGENRLNLRVSFRCTFDFTGAYLAIEQSEFALLLPSIREPIVRFDYVRDRPWAAAHVQLHAESSAAGFLRAHARKASETWRLHPAVGGRRFRPSLEDVIEFAITEFSVEAQAGWAEQIAAGRQRWRLLQTKAAIRDAIKDDPIGAPAQLKETVDAAVAALTEDE